MVLTNSLYVLPRHANQIGIIIYNNPQGQEIMRLNGKKFNTIYTIADDARHNGFIYKSNDKEWYLQTNDTRPDVIMHYHKLFSTTYYLSELDHYWLCPHCLSAVPSSWIKCAVCNNESLR